jgi:hypothetical protein
MHAVYVISYHFSFTCMSYRVINSKVMMDVIYEVGSVWKETVMTFSIMLSKPMPEGTEKTMKKSNQFVGKSSRDL